MINLATFNVVLSSPSTVPVTVDFTTVDDTAVGYRDYIITTGSLTFAPGTTSRSVTVRVVGDTMSKLSRKFRLVLSNPREAVLGVQFSDECVISAPVAYPAVPFPGRRMAILGDSIMYANNLWNPPSATTVSGKTAVRNEYYSTGMTGAVSYANQILGNAFSLQAALQPNTNPGANATSPNVGYNFAIYSSKVSQWTVENFDPAPIPGVTANNRGPMYNALLYLDKFDLVTIMGGTNDISVNARPQAILANLMGYATQFATAGKWVFLCTITPRTADLLQFSPTGAGYMQSEVAQIMQGILAVNEGLRDWLTPAPRKDIPNNIFLVDAWDKMVGPTPTILPGIPTDPAGQLSPASGITTGSYIPFTPGNYRTDAPGLRFMYDGLHMAPPAAYVLGKEMARVMKDAGIPASPSENVEGGNAAGVGQLSFGPNLMLNKTFAKGTSAARAPGSALVLGRAIGLGAPVANPSFAAITGITKDVHTNQGSGYQHGQVPDYWFIYRASNSDTESFSNFNGFTYSTLNSRPEPAPMSYQTDATWADGCLTTAITTENFSINGRTFSNEPGFALTFNRAAGIIGPDTAQNNCAFVARYTVAEGQHNHWDGFGYEVFPQAPWPTPPFAPGERLMMDCILKYTGLTPNLCAARVALNLLSIDFTNDASYSAVISSLAQAESFFPWKYIRNNHHHTEDRYMHVRLPIITVPTPAAGETAFYAQMVWQFSFDCETQPASGTITIIRPRLCKVTVPSSGL